MKAVQLVEIGKPLELHELPLPEPGPDEIRVRVLAAGICHSDVHYRTGTAGVGFLPIIPGHEVAGLVDKLGTAVDGTAVGERVALHYLFTCGQCEFCMRGFEQFCRGGRMLGKHVNGGYAEYVIAPACNAIPITDAVSTQAAAIMMCSSATAFHALRKARMAAGERVAVFGIGGLGLSAIQLARICGAAEIFAIDIDQDKLKAAQGYGAQPINPAHGTPEQQLRDHTDGHGVDIALELVGLPTTQQQAVASLGIQGRAVLAGISGVPFVVESYPMLIGRELEIIGVSDHLRGELVTLMEFAQHGLLDLESVITDRIALDADQINNRLDALAEFHGKARSVILMD